MAYKELSPGTSIICEVLETRSDGYWVRIESHNCFGLLAFDGPLKPKDRVLATFSGWDKGHMLLSISGTNAHRGDDNWGALMGVLTAPPTPSNKVLASFDVRREKSTDLSPDLSNDQARPQRQPIIIDGDEDED